MKKKDLKEWKIKKQADIESEITNERKKLGELRLGLVSGKVKNIKSIRAVRKNIAQLLTIKSNIAIKSKNQ